MLLSHPKQSKNVRNTPEILVWVRCTDIMSVGPLPWDNNIFMGVLMSRGVQRVSNSKAHWDELQNCVEWGLGVFEYLTVTNWCSPQHVFYAAAVKSHQHLLLKKTCYLNRGLCGLQFKTRLHLSICIVWFPLHVQNKWDSVKNSALFKCLNDS